MQLELMISCKWLLTCLTFPGVIVHELAHQLACKVFKVAVLDVCYFSLKNPYGHVTHENPKEIYQDIFIAFAPFIFNNVIGALVAFPSAITLLTFDSGSIVDLFLLWVGVSIAMHSFPSMRDTSNIWSSVWRKENGVFLKLILTPIIGLNYICNFVSAFCLDLFYGVFVIIVLPFIISQKLLS